MPLFSPSDQHNLDALREALRSAQAVTAPLMSDIIRHGCRRFPPAAPGKRAARILAFVQSCAWTDAALALIELEMPMWQMRRLAYDEGEWHCALSRQRELPEWLDQSIEARHADLALAILSAFVEAQATTASLVRSSVPGAPVERGSFYQPLCADDFA